MNCLQSQISTYRASIVRPWALLVGCFIFCPILALADTSAGDGQLLQPEQPLYWKLPRTKAPTGLRISAVGGSGGIDVSLGGRISLMSDADITLQFRSAECGLLGDLAIRQRDTGNITFVYHSGVYSLTDDLNIELVQNRGRLLLTINGRQLDLSVKKRYRYAMIQSYTDYRVVWQGAALLDGKP